MITTILFDLDGTLVPYDERERLAVSYLAEQGIVPNRFHAVNREGWDEVCAGRLHIEEKWHRHALALGASPETADEFVKRMVAFEPAYDDVLPLLDQLEGRYRLGVVTNGPPGDHQRAKLTTAGLDRFFGEYIFISCEVGAAKPDPRIFQHALDRLGARAAETVMIGDNLKADVQGAIAMGIRGIWLNRDGKTEDGADGVPVTNSLWHILSLIREPHAT